MFTDKEKELLKSLVKKELDEFGSEEKSIRPNPTFLAAEEKYEDFLEGLLKKF